MPRYSNKDFRFPLNNDLTSKLTGLWFRLVAYQGTPSTAAVVAVSAATSPLVLNDGQITTIECLISKAYASGESMVVDVQKSTDGAGTWASILTATKTLDSTTTARSQIDISSLIDPAKSSLNVGDQVRVNLTYTAGGGPAAPSLTVTVHPRSVTL